MKKIFIFLLIIVIPTLSFAGKVPGSPPLPGTAGASEGDALLLDANLDKVWGTPAGGGTVDTSGSPEASDISQFSDADTITGRSYSEHALDMETELEGVLDLPSLQGQLLGSQVDIASTSDTLDEYIGFTTMNCVMEAIVITDEGGLNIQYSAGKVWIDDVIQDTDARGTNLAMTDDSTNYIYATKAGGATVQVATSDPGGVHALIARIYTVGGDIEYMLTEPLCDGQVETIHDSLDDILSVNVTNGVEVAIDADGTNANDFTVSTGTYYLHAHNKITVSSIIYSAGVGHGDTNISRYYHSSSAWVSEAANGVDFGFWDNGTDKTAVNASSWYTAWIFAEGETSVDYVYPQTQHVTEAAALAEAITYPPFHQGFAVPLAAFVFRGSQSDFTVPSRTYFEDIRPIILGLGARTASQFVYATFTGDSGSQGADAILDSFDFAGGTGITTVVSGKVLTINLDSGYTRDDTAETITANWVNTANPWADDEVANDLTVSGGSVNASVIGGSTPAAGTFLKGTVSALAYTPLTAEPTEVVGEFYRADNDTWDPGPVTGTNDYLVICTAAGSPGTFLPIMDLITGDWLISSLDMGGGVFEGPNGTSGTTDAAGEQYFDTDGDGSTITNGRWQVYNGAANVYLYPITGTPTDNQIPKYDAGTNLLTFDTDASGSAGAYESGTEVDFYGTILDPQGVYDNDSTNHALSFAVNIPAAFTITAIYISCDADPTTEPTLTFQHKAAGVGYGSPTTIEAVTTTAGVASITSGIDDATIPADTKLFVTLSDPDDALTEITWQIKGDWD